MQKTKLTAEPRSESGTSAAKRMRRAGKIPAVLYGDGSAEPIVLDTRDFRHAIHGTGGATIFDMTVTGHKPTPAIIKEIQRNPIRDEIIHVDFQKIAMTERIHAPVPIHLVGDSPGVKMGGVLQHAQWEVDVSAPAQDMPEMVEVDLSGLNIGDSIHVSDISLAQGVEMLASPDTIIVAVLAPTVVVEEVVEVAEEEGAVEGEAAAEGKPGEETEGEG